MLDHDLRRAIHGVLLAAFDGAEVPTWIAEADGLAGVVLFGVNTPDAETTARLARDLHRIHPTAIVAIDEEGGNVTRVQARGGSSLPGNAALGVLDDVGATRASARALGELLRACDIDLTLAPVLDIASDPDNPVIGARSFGEEPELVARHGVAFVEGLHEAGLAACGKHPPGHGDTGVDSHLGLPELNLETRQLDERELVPFRAAFEAGIDSVMTGHLLIPALGPAPASIEPAVTSLLRSSGFEGAIITDALDMGGVLSVVGGDIGEAAVRALGAGADLLCLGSPDHIDGEVFADVVEAIGRAVDGGSISRERLASAAARGRALRRPTVGTRTLAEAEAELESLGAEVAARAVSSTGDIALRPGDGILDLRFRTDQAAGIAVEGFTGVVADTLSLERGVRPGHRLALVVADRSERTQAQVDRHPDAVVLHTGAAGSAPRAANLVLAHGAGRANAIAVTRALAAAPTTKGLE